MERKLFLKLITTGGLIPASLFQVKAKKDSILQPKPLKKGDTIGLVSPASIVGDDQEYNEVTKRITQLGYRVKEGANARKKYGYFAGTDEQRAADLNAMFADPEVDAVMPFRGGWGSNRILHHIDYDLIKKHPKILVGYSDITSLLLAIYKKTGLITFHGPVAKSIWTAFTIDHFERTLESSQLHSIKAVGERSGNEYGCLSTIHPGKANGRLLGGNISILTSMIGSGYLPNWDNAILFSEDIGEDVYRIDRMLTQLKMSGVLDRISGFIFGQCTACDISEPRGFTLNEILDQHIRPLGIPAFSGARIGHIDDMLTLPIGINVEIDADEGIISFKKPALGAEKV